MNVFTRHGRVSLQRFWYLSQSLQKRALSRYTAAGSSSERTKYKTALEVAARTSDGEFYSSLRFGPLWLVLLGLSAVKLGVPTQADAKASEEEENITEEVCGVAKYAANKPIEDRNFVARLDNGGW